MSSWIPSFFSPNPDPSSDEDNPTSPSSSSPNKTPKTPSSGVKDDLSSVFRGVAAFLAPPPGNLISGDSSSASDAIAGIKSDLAEIQGSFKSGLSLISSKLTSNFLQFQKQLNDDDYDDEVEEEEEDEEEYVVGITEEVVDFVRKLSNRPELWVDFPLALSDDFDLSDYQREHAAYIDHLVPELVTLRRNMESQISDLKFWIIYFVLLFPRLNEEDLKLLSTPQVVEVRETLLKKLQNKSNTIQDTSENPETSDDNKDCGKGYISEGDESTSQHKDVSSEIVNAKNNMDSLKNRETEHTSEEEAESSTSVVLQKQSENEEDISFSDLEDDDNDLSEKLSGLNVSNSNNVLRGEASEWVQLNENSGSQGGQNTAYQSGFREKESEGEDSNDWLAVDDNDFDSLGAI